MHGLMPSWGIMAIESKLRPFMHCLESKLNPNKQGQIGIKCRACWHVLCPGTVRASAAAVPSRPMRLYTEICTNPAALDWQVRVHF
jgi:hypothetical protein